MENHMRNTTLARTLGRLVILSCAAVFAAEASAEQLAKTAFGAMKLPAAAAPAAHGFYSKGCFAGGMAIATDGPTWQAMRLSRNRRWGHPEMINLIERLSRDATKIGWPGLLLGDISQPRGGPMLSGHASHQIGLDADIWLTPMPDRRLTAQEREQLSATSMLQKNGKGIYVNDKVWTPQHLGLLKTAASYPQVERVLVHPGIKKKLCDTAKGDRGWLGKVRPYWGHHYHFHVRIGCPAGSTDCKGQKPVTGDDGCGAELDDWFALLTAPPKPPKPGEKPKPPARDILKVSDLPAACRVVLDAPSPGSEAEVTLTGGGARVAKKKKAPEPELAVIEQPAPEPATATMPDVPRPEVDVPLPQEKPSN
jgi:penicillin-insensitive murein DD-endopeptidase